MPRPPKFQPRRTNARVGPLMLPSEGRSDPPPAWPLIGQSEPEANLWAELWTKPQAVAWEDMDCAGIVALYCRVKLLAEAPGASPAMVAQTIALSDRLGLSPKAMKWLLWQIAPIEEESEGVEPGKVIDIRDRIQAVE